MPTTVPAIIPPPNDRAKAWADVRQSFGVWWLWWRMTQNALRTRYRRTVLGPFWATITTGIFVMTLGTLYSVMWRIEIKDFLPYLTSGYIVWQYIAIVISEGSFVFIYQEEMLKQTPLPYLLFSVVLVLRNLIVMAHHLLILLLLMIFLPVPITLNTLLVIPGLLLLTFTSLWVVTILGMACARFRDIPQLIANLLMILMFITPVLYRPEQLGTRWSFVADANILYHFITIVRDPLLGVAPNPTSWLVASSFSVVGALLAFLLFARYRRYLVFWL